MKEPKEWLEQRLGVEGAEVMVEYVEQLRRAITNASYCLDPNQGERPDPYTAYRWLRTTYSRDHPNYVDPRTLPPGFK